MPSYRTCPATCELCGNWLPQHNGTCPRNGVHPSQWRLDKDMNYDKSIEDLTEESAHEIYTQLPIIDTIPCNKPYTQH